MPFVHSKSTRVLFDGLDVSAWLTGLEYGVVSDAQDVTTFLKSWKNFWPGTNSGTVSMSGIHDKDMQTLRSAVTGAVDNILTWSPQGLATLAEMVHLMAVTDQGYKESMPVGGMVLFDWAANADDAVGSYGQLFHPLAAETATGTSAFVDGGAATTTGAVAHLHVTALAGTAPTVTVKFSDCATSGGSYVDIAGGAFTLMNAVGGQRLVIPGTIRQFVKATWTITGSAGQSLTFATALART